MTGTLDRSSCLDEIRIRDEPWDLVIIGGGATGIGVALDAASRGLSVVLVERFDFGSGTSSRSTKLVHGGVRYLKQGNITLVRDALRERSLLRDNAPHQVHDKSFLIPCQSIWQWFFYGIGLKLYDLLATGDQFGRSRWISAKQTSQIGPAIRPDKMKRAILYHDGQFDDARLLIDMARTAREHNACMVNYVSAIGLIKNDAGRVTGVHLEDTETGETIDVSASLVINAAGPFCDEVRRLDQPNGQPMVAASQGVHLVLPRSFYPSDNAMIVPKTSDGRVIFIVPWHDHAIVGTTDTAIPKAVAEPVAQTEEIRFLIETASQYLQRPLSIGDVLSVFTGIRPLVKGDPSARTASLSRDHVIQVSDSKLLTITGGKWTTVRKMAEDCVDRAIETASLGSRSCQTKTLRILDSGRGRQELEREHPELAEPVHESLPFRRSHVVWAVRSEMARTAEDVLARRTRALFLNARAAVECAPKVIEWMSQELDADSTWKDQQLQRFTETAKCYLPP